MPKPATLSGIQPTGKLHIGNYLGALKNFVELQDSGKHRCFFAVVDLHSLTEDFTAGEKRQQILELTADFLAAGLDPERSVIFQQSQVPAHAELTWIFLTGTPMGELERMTQYKDKASRQQNNLNAGLLTYPVLQAADILLYSPPVVPVGEDQAQHIELARTIARKFNKNFGPTFVEPKILLTQAPRIMSLKDSSKKMSKSQPEGCLFLDDEPKVVMDKLKRAVTDSGTTVFYDPENKPAISNLLRIWAGLTGESLDNAEERFAGKTYAQFKGELGETVAGHFAAYRTKKTALMKKPGTLKRVLKEGSEKAATVAQKKLLEVKKKMGILI